MKIEAVRGHSAQLVSHNNEATKPSQRTGVSNQEAVPKAGSAGLVSELRNREDRAKYKVLNHKSNLPSPPKRFAQEATVAKIGSYFIIDSGAGDDKIAVTQDEKTGKVTVNVNGASRTFSEIDSAYLVIRAGDGNDTITVNKGVTVSLQLEGNRGNDAITADQTVESRLYIFGGDGNDKLTGSAGDDKIDAGDGDDTVDGGVGDDYINGSKGNDVLSGNLGNDVIYAGDGDDVLNGGEGDDHLDGGIGNDVISGEVGNDVLSGGIGDDTLEGGIGDDVLYAGQGTDKLEGGFGNNKIFAQDDDKVNENGEGVNNTVVKIELKGNPGSASIVIAGSEKFQERIEADLEMLRSSPTGRKMLEAFDAAHEKDKVTVTIKESNDSWVSRTDRSIPGPHLTWNNAAKKFEKGTPNSVNMAFDPTAMIEIEHSNGDFTDIRPIILFNHELAHAYDFTHGTTRNKVYRGDDKVDSEEIEGAGIVEAERVAIGLPIDHDGDPATPEAYDNAFHPLELTEKGLRDEMNLSPRYHYNYSRLMRY